MISIDYSLIIVILNFLLLLVILNKLLYKPIKQFLVERQSSIAEDLEQAEKSKVEHEELVRKQQEEYKKSAYEIRKMKEQAKKDSGQQSEMIIKEARTRERKLLAETEKQLAHEKQKALKEIEGEIGEAIATLSASIIGKHLDEKIDSEIIGRLLSEERSKK